MIHNLGGRALFSLKSNKVYQLFFFHDYSYVTHYMKEHQLILKFKQVTQFSLIFYKLGLCFSRISFHLTHAPLLEIPPPGSSVISVDSLLVDTSTVLLNVSFKNFFTCLSLWEKLVHGPIEIRENLSFTYLSKEIISTDNRLSQSHKSATNILHT